MHNLSGVILPTDRYKHICSKGAYSILPFIVLYYDTINRDATRTEVHQAKGKHKAKRNDRALYETAYTACKNFIMEVVDKTWYKELEDPDMFCTNVTSLKILDHITEFFFRASYCQFRGHSTTDEDYLHQRRWNSAIHQCGGSGAAKVQAGKTCHTRREYARYGAEITT